MVDRPTIRPQTLQRASGGNVPTLRDVNVPNLRGIGRVSASGFDAASRAAAQTAQVIQNVGDEVLNTVNTIEKRKREREAELEKQRQAEIEAQIDLGEEFPELLVTADIADIDANLSLDLEEITSRTNDPEEVAKLYSARVSGVTSTLDESSSMAIQGFADIRLDAEVEKLTADAVQRDAEEANQKIEGSLAQSYKEGVESASTATLRQGTKFDASTQKYFSLVDASNKTPSEKTLLKARYQRDMTEKALLNEVTLSSTPLNKALQITRGGTGDPFIDNLPEDVRAAVLNKGIQINSALIAQKNQIDAARKEARANARVQEEIGIYLDPTNPESSDKLKRMLESATTGEELSRVVKLESYVNGRTDKADIDRQDDIEKTFRLMVSGRQFSKERMQFELTQFASELDPTTLNSLLNDINDMDNDLFNSTTQRLIDLELDDAFPKSKKLSPIEAIARMKSGQSSVDTNADTNKRDAISRKLLEDVRSGKIVTEDEYLEAARVEIAKQKSVANQSVKDIVTSVSGIDYSTVEYTDRQRSTIDKLVKNQEKVTLANKYIINGRINAVKLARDFKDKKITQREWQEISTMLSPLAKKKESKQ